MRISDWSSVVCSSDLVAVTIWNVVAQGFASKGIAGWWLGQPWFQEGLEYLEAGRIADVVILIGFSILAYVTLRTFPPRKQWNEIHWALALGVVALTLVWKIGRASCRARVCQYV